MAKKKRTKSKWNYLALVLFLIAVGVFFHEEFGKDETRKDTSGKQKEKKTIAPVSSRPVERPTTSTLPRVAIVMDDLGNNRESAEQVLGLKGSITLSILPHQAYSAWIANRGAKLGRDILVHIPMEAAKPLELGEGGIYTWMTDAEIASALEKDIQSIPGIKGASSHMGSALTKDQRSMSEIVSILKRHKLFYLDSVTTPETVGPAVAREKGVPVLSRDIFLDNSEEPDKINIQWNELVSIARKKGYAIALAHPKKGTLEFLRSKLESNDEVKVVPVSELFP